jgi:hypothetical protein
MDKKCTKSGRFTGIATQRRVPEDRTLFPLSSNDPFKTLRRARAKKFPYALFFLIEPDTLLVVACFHSSRDPRHWQKRV